MAIHNDLGHRGESIAVAYLKQLGYKIVEQNWRYKNSEIDIIAQHSDMLIFIEVKTRSSDFWGYPEDAVSIYKQKRIVNAADYYLQLQESNYSARFDIISIILNKNTHKLNHIDDAFFAPLD